MTDQARLEERRGRCYELAIEAVSPLLCRPPLSCHLYQLEGCTDIRLVHGQPHLQRHPYEKYGHAWLEYVDELGLLMAWDPVREEALQRFLYYAIGHIEEEDCFRYTIEEARRMAVKFGHYGPWEGPLGVPPVER